MGGSISYIFQKRASTLSTFSLNNQKFFLLLPWFLVHFSHACDNLHVTEWKCRTMEVEVVQPHIYCILDDYCEIPKWFLQEQILKYLHFVNRQQENINIKGLLPGSFNLQGLLLNFG